MPRNPTVAGCLAVRPLVALVHEARLTGCAAPGPDSGLTATTCGGKWLWCLLALGDVGVSSQSRLSVEFNSGLREALTVSVST